MKILLVVPYFYPKIGGLENYALHIALGLQKSYSCTVVVVTANHLRKTYEVDNVNGIKIYRLPIMFTVSNTPINPAWYFQLSSIIKIELPDVINGHMPVPFIADIAARISQSLHIPYILTYQNDIHKSDFLLSTIVRLYYILLGRTTIKLSKRIIVTSDYFKENSSNLSGYIDKLTVIPPGISTNLIAQSKVLDGSSSNSPYVLFVGQLDKSHSHKGLELLLASIKILHDKNNQISLHVVGDGDYKRYYEKFSETLGIRKYVKFMGRVSDRLLAKEYSQCLTTVLPSTNDSEGFGMVLTEAGYFKKPVIGSKIGGIPYVISDETGILVSPGEPNELSDAIQFLLSHPANSQKMGLQAYKTVIHKYTWEKQYKKTYELFKNV